MSAAAVEPTPSYDINERGRARRSGIDLLKGPGAERAIANAGLEHAGGKDVLLIADHCDESE